ncbi:MAG: type II toxin-antitoxin system Phd/YefM family antitoxin [Acidobacteria bacterium]|nr:type II toxin-antitoxin system Phd/YefM family antitoxin [Acidobacteriota bacterium]
MPTVTLSDAKTNLARLLAEVDRLGERVVITRSGRPATAGKSTIAFATASADPEPRRSRNLYT